ncbi:hypothetical protein [Nonomuraea sp. NPDC002799]
MDFQGWSGGLALLPRDYLGQGEPLGAVVQTAGPLQGEALYLFALGTAATMARLHLGGIAGLRLEPGNVMIGPRGQAFFAPGPRSSEFPSQDVRDWAGVMVFAATGRHEGRQPDLGRVPPALHSVIDECRRQDAGARPTAVDLVRILLGRSGTTPRSSVPALLREAEQRTRSYVEPYARERRTRPYAGSAPRGAVAVPKAVWRRPAYLVGIAVGVLVVTVAAGAVTVIAGGQDGRASVDVVSAIGRRTATFHQEGAARLTRFAADGELSFDQNAADAAYEMRVTCQNATTPVAVSLVGSKGVAGGVPFDVERPQAGPCAPAEAPSIRRYSSPHTIKALLEAAGTNTSSTSAPGAGRTITGTAMGHRIRGEDVRGSYGTAIGEGPIRFEVAVNGDGLPTRLRIEMDSRFGGPLTVETVYGDWRAFEGAEVPHG